MRYIHQTGYDAIIALESETCLQQLHQQFASLGSTPTAVTLRHGTKTADVTVQPGDTLRALLEQLSWQTDDLKAVHIGYPVGGLFTAQVLDKPLTAALQKRRREGNRSSSLIFCNAHFIAAPYNGRKTVFVGGIL